MNVIGNFVVIILVVGHAVGCAFTRPGPAEGRREIRHFVYEDGSSDDARLLTPDAAKAIIVARCARVDSRILGGRGYGGQGQQPLVYDVYSADGGWYVYCHGGPDGVDNTAFVNHEWRSGALSFGPPPVEAIGPRTTRQSE